MTLSELFTQAHELTRLGVPTSNVPYKVAFRKNLATLRLQHRQALAASQRRIKDTDSLLTAIAKLGGLGRRVAESEGIDPANFLTRRAGIFYVFTKGGRSLDDLAVVLAEYGYFATHQEVGSVALLGMIIDEIDDQCTHYNVIGAERKLEQDLQHWAAAQAADEYDHMISMGDY